MSSSFLLTRRWGVALVTAVVVAAIPGTTPITQELGMLEKGEDDLKFIREQSRKLFPAPKK